MITSRLSKRLFSVVVIGIALSASLAAAGPAKPLKVRRFRSVAGHTHAFITDDDSSSRVPGVFLEESIPEGLRTHTKVFRPRMHLSVESILEAQLEAGILV